ncbi:MULTISPECIES: thiamine ABC transporter substrate binding subunit [Aeromonas]|uniref:Thiamine-binding periplasmic protein n=1 Tax=Aeromonas veronii TaxID=654 RepID=A0AAW5M7K4_AERVE|nr:thiamine ABC transporter substrate binding subunit [Aeromonas veronii]MCR6551053.1 thiamine ABC transporter substrate binding subunit [Aeromonas sp. CPF2-S1]HDT6078997.1 thiamine ABC transporter substrate binding subunit [Aeromonas veronii bv. veronii]MBL0488158.1 thiamine ABC transporter substrate binding subunit [Aeromonas veronii]MBL0503753.1 thiamine ABC transporter substrate binding subunit [Aeromonas veronii]MCR4446914.1 thiamine ABC transporter substrate binding subunit [Aeromonas ve
MKTLLLVTTGLLSANVFAADTLTVYTYSSFTAEWGPGPKIKQAFEKACDCTLNLVPLEDGVAILNRLRLEGNHSKADLVLGLDDALISEAKQSGLFAPHPAKLDGIKVPGGWQDDTFVPYDYGYFAFVYDKDKLKQPPKSLKELVERPDLKVIYQDPRTSTPGQGLMLWMKSVYGDKAPAAWAELAKKTVTVTKGWSEAYGMFLDGEADMVLSYTTSPAYHLIAENKPQYQAAAFEEGHYRQVEVAAKLKSAKQEKLADQFLQFMVSPTFQQEIPTGNWMYPVIDTPQPKGFEQMITVAKPLAFSSDEVAANRKGWIREWLQAVTQ